MIITDDQLKQLLLKTGILDQKGLDDLVVFAKNSALPLEEAIIEKDIMSDQNLGLLISDSIKMPFVILGNLVIPEELFHVVPFKIARKQRVIAFGKDEHGIKLAIADPRNAEIAEMIQQKTGLHVSLYLATTRDIENTLRMYRMDLQKAFAELAPKEITPTNVALTNDVPIAKIVDLIITYAYEDKASDLHIEPKEEESLVRFRIDGILHDMLVFPKNLHDRIVTRIKVLAKLRTDEHLSAQDGKMRIQLEEENLDIRVSIIPIVEGEKVVLRLLSAHARQFSLIDLGMTEKDLQKVKKSYNKSYGMILSTGPTGSGKTTSIYAILKIINTREKNITTVEDPVEYRIQGVNQVQVNTKTNLTFANGLRSLLRQDPNVIFVGEIRDNETAGIAVNAALTGHLVLSTLHTNDAATAIPRLVDMDVEPFLVASTVNVIIAQRLLRRICELCKSSLMVTREELTKNLSKEVIEKNFPNKPEFTVYFGKGCKVCHMTGYAGRVGLFEVLEVTEAIKALIIEKNDANLIAKKAIEEGMTTMLDDGLQKVLKGDTTLEEVLRITKVETM